MSLRILVVDDSAPVRERIAELVRSIDGVGEVAEVATLADAGRALAEWGPDVLVADIALPDGSGIDLVARARHAKQPVIVVMLTNYVTAPYRDRCLAAGADFFLDKTSDVARLGDIVAQLAQARGADR